MTGPAVQPVNVEVAPGLWRIRLPFHLELNHVNVHLVRLQDGWMLVDCGVGTPDSRATLEAALEEAGVGWGDIRTVLVTHCHPDHVGNLGYIVDRTGARLLMHTAEAALLQRIASSVSNGTPFDTALADWGTPAEMVQAIQNEMRGSWRQFPWREPDRLLDGGETLETALGPLEVIHTPGHARGHLCLFFRERRILITGDHLLPSITPNIGWIPDGDSLANYLASLRAVSELDAELALPSHGDPFENPRARAAETAAHHDSRCQEVMRALSEGPATPYQVTLALWGDTLSPFQRRFGLYEAMAHLEHLERLRRVRRIGELSAVRYVVIDGDIG
jgi:glyoxylase-like metal-dependent hydrolase (beta-lactamase superfamily II)